MEKKDLLANYAASKQNMCITNDTISDRLFQEYGVNRGLRDVNGKGVLTGLTRISKIVSFKDENGKQVPCDGELWYRGYNVKTLIKSIGPNEFGFEKAAYLLLFGELPDQAQLDEFCEVLGNSRTLPTNFTRDVIMKAPSKDIMNSMTRSILTLAAYDPYTTDSSIENNIRQCMQLIANFPMIAAYGYHAYNHYENDQSMYIHRPDPKLSTAENFLRMLRADNQYTELEARVLDVALVLHAEHGGGNNSTFTTHVVTSSGTDTYSTIAASIASLKGPKHGGANLKVTHMIENIKENVKNWEDEAEIEEYLTKILDKQAFDGAGLIYGMGHAVYTLSDPREVILKRYAKSLSDEKGLTKEFELLDRIERIAGRIIAERRRLFKPICANVDFYSGFVYTMLGIPEELFTPIFAISRISGWSAHRLEELVNKGKIIRPAYKYVGWHKPYYDIEHRLGDVNDNWK